MNVFNSINEATKDKIYKGINMEGIENCSIPQAERVLANALQYGVFEHSNTRNRVRGNILDDEDTIYWQAHTKRERTPHRLESYSEYYYNPEKDRKRFRKFKASDFEEPIISSKGKNLLPKRDGEGSQNTDTASSQKSKKSSSKKPKQDKIRLHRYDKSQKEKSSKTGHKKFPATLQKKITQKPQKKLLRQRQALKQGKKKIKKEVTLTTYITNRRNYKNFDYSSSMEESDSSMNSINKMNDAVTVKEDIEHKSNNETDEEKLQIKDFYSDSETDYDDGFEDIWDTKDNDGMNDSSYSGGKNCENIYPHHFGYKKDQLRRECFLTSKLKNKKNLVAVKKGLKDPAASWVSEYKQAENNLLDAWCSNPDWRDESRIQNIKEGTVKQYDNALKIEPLDSLPFRNIEETSYIS